jgi:uncharacterized protein
MLATAMTTPRVEPTQPGPGRPMPLRTATAPMGRVRLVDATPAECRYAFWMHLSLLTNLVLWPVGAVIPLVMWATPRRTPSGFVDDHGTEIANLLITGAILSVLLALLLLPGWILLAIWYLVAAISAVRGGVAAKRGEYFRYPMTIRFL